MVFFFSCNIRHVQQTRGTVKMSNVEYELVYSEKKKKMVKRKIKASPKGLDRLEGSEESKEVTDEMLKPYIFSQYFRDIEFDLKTLKKELPISRRSIDISVELYMEFMGDYLNRIRLGRVPDKSYFISAPDGFGKKIFAYQVIKEALAHRLTPTTIIQSHDLYTMLNEHRYTDFYNQFKGVDLGIITFGGAPSKVDLIVVKTALEHCERYDIPLLILSRFEPEMFYKIDPLTKQYLGVSVAKRGNFGQAELKGFNRKKMMDIRNEFNGEGNTNQEADDYIERKRKLRREKD